jgi:hypothetical protein
MIVPLASTIGVRRYHVDRTELPRGWLTEQLAAAPADQGLVMRDVWLLRMRALLARACGEEVAYVDLANRYRAMARSLQSLRSERHIAWR